jgi:hypothetical protein
MNMLVGFIVGVIATAVITGVMAGIATVTFGNMDPWTLCAGIAAGTVLVLVLVAYLA